MSKEDLIEKDVKMTGTNETVPGPVDTGSTKRKLDKNVKGEDKDTKEVEDNGVKTPQNKGSDKMMKEHIDSIFDGEDFSEEFKEKVAIVFEAAVGEEVDRRAEEIKEELEKSMQSDMEEMVQEEVDKIAESMDSYLDIIVEKWLEENKLAVESSRKVEMAESIIDGIAYIYEQNNMNIEQGDVDHVSELEEEVEKLNGTVNTLMESLKATKKAISGYERKEVIEEISEGLSETDKDRMFKLTESIDYSDKNEFAKKAEIIKENFFGAGNVNAQDEELEELNEGVQEDAKPKTTDPSMQELIKRMRSDSFRV